MNTVRHLALVITCALASSGAATAADTQIPNVLLILVDDLKPTLGCYGDPVARTPNIDALAGRGMRFDRAYCNQAVCAPSRFTLMLGSHSTSTGLYGLGSQLREIVPDAVTLPQHFAKYGGYRTESLGKVFHIGHGNEGDPQSFSVPHFKDKVIEYLDPKSTDGGKLTREEALFTNQRLDQIKSLPRGAAFESPVAEDEAYADGRVAAETINRLRAAKERREKDATPFFIAAGFVRPHLPFSVPKKYWDLYDPTSLPMPQFEELPAGAPEVAGKRGGEITAYDPVPAQGKLSPELTRQLIHGYYAGTSFVDAQIGKVIDELDRLGLANNTIVVLWGDHGFHLGDLGIWTKHTNYEQANRIPILIAAPGVTTPGSSTNQPAESVDIFPTLAELAGLPAPTGPQPIDGLSLVPVLKVPEARVRDHAYHAYPKSKIGRAIRTERYRLVEWHDPAASPDDTEYELYDYESDPLETRNLAAGNPELVEKLLATLAKYPGPVGQAGKTSDPKVAAPSEPAISPSIAQKPLTIIAEVATNAPQGVVLAQGGKEHGYALHFVDGQAAFDVRVDGEVTRVMTKAPGTGRIRLEATLDPETMSLAVNRGQPASRPSPGLIPAQPKDGLSIGMDALSAAGDYEAPNPFNGQVLSHQVVPGKVVAPPAPAIFKSREGRWTAERANAWYDAIEWPVGANFVPSSAINQLEMWQADTFDPETIDRELGWAAGLGMNTMRVFLHDIPWRNDPQGFFDRVDRYLEIADKHGIRTMFVIFDGVWHPHPKAGPQPEPVPGVHNSGWVQSPGRSILDDPAKQDALKHYVQAVISRYREDERVLVWDLFNEPNNPNRNSYGEAGRNIELPPVIKEKRAAELVEKTFAWAREIDPIQPLTVGVWRGDYLQYPTAYQRLCIEHSDVISFHTYDPPAPARALTEGLLQLGRPLFCTEYMARGNNSTFEGILPIFYEKRVAAYNWGFVDGRSQTIYPWDSWKKPCDTEPDPWFHDIFRRDGTPYRPAEVRFIHQRAVQVPTKPSRPPETPSAMSREEIESGLKSHDRALFVKEGWIRDPFITHAPDGWFYLTGTTPNTNDPREKGDPYNTGLGADDNSIVGSVARVWRTKDFVSWESLGAPFTLKDGIWAKTKPEKFRTTPKDEWFLWAPELHWIDHLDRWALVHTSPSPVQGANLSLSSGPKVAGPWSNPIGEKIGRRHDPSLFKDDDDGTWWLVYGATTIAPLKPDFSDFAGNPVHIKPSGDTAKMGHEGCLIMKIHGQYVLFGTGWSTGEMRRGSYNLYYATADKITGPYSERKFAGRFLGHGTPFQDDEGKWWCTAFFNGNIPPLDRKDIETTDLRKTAQTINQRGTTIVPLDVRLLDNGDLHIRAKDPAYATPGPDEAQSFAP